MREIVVNPSIVAGEIGVTANGKVPSFVIVVVKHAPVAIQPKAGVAAGFGKVMMAEALGVKGMRQL